MSEVPQENPHGRHASPHTKAAVEKDPSRGEVWHRGTSLKRKRTP